MKKIIERMIALSCCTPLTARLERAHSLRSAMVPRCQEQNMRTHHTVVFYSHNALERQNQSKAQKEAMWLEAEFTWVINIWINGLNRGTSSVHFCWWLPRLTLHRDRNLWKQQYGFINALFDSQSDRETLEHLRRWRCFASFWRQNPKLSIRT